MNKTYFLWSLLGLFCLHLGWAQQKTITGAVNDDDGFPLPGATVVVEGTNRGVATDFDGNFSIETQKGETLLITYIGYSDYQLLVGSQDSYTISLSPDNELEEVVLSALGFELKKDEDISSATLVKSEQIVRSGETGLLQGIAVKTSGGCCLVKKTTMGLLLGLPWAISIIHKGRPNLLFPMVFHCT